MISEVYRMNMEIREIEKRDYDAVLALWNNELNNAAINAEMLTAFYDHVSGDPAYKTFVAVIDGQTVGFVTTVQVAAVGMPVGYLKINGLAVQTAHQRAGVGTRLLEYTEQYARGKKLSAIILNSGMQRTAAHAFYQKNHYDRDSYCFDKSLK